MLTVICRNFSFEDVHIAGPRRIARIAKECGVEKFIHFSHINANYNAKQHKVFLKGGSRFLQTKVRHYFRAPQKVLSSHTNNRSHDWSMAGRTSGSWPRGYKTFRAQLN